MRALLRPILAISSSVLAGQALAGRRRVLAVDGKTVRGSRQIGSDGVEVLGRHLFAVIDQHSRVVLGQLAVAVLGVRSPVSTSTKSPDRIFGRGHFVHNGVSEVRCGPWVAVPA